VPDLAEGEPEISPDNYTIVFHLKTPSAPLVSQALVMPITVPVPEEYA
jgi:peptide/nickel transport system substrate-binding protein